MSRGKALANFLEVVKNGRLDSEKGLDRTFIEVKDREARPIQEALPEELPTKPDTPPAEPPPEGAPAAPEGTPGAGAPPTTRTSPLDAPAPLTQAEGQRAIDAANAVPPEDLNFSNLNRRRIDTEDDVGGLVDELIRQKQTKGEGIGPKETAEGVRARARKVRWREITQAAADKSPLNIEQLRYAREVEAELLSDLQVRAMEIKKLGKDGDLTPEMELRFREDAAKVATISRYISGEKRRTAQLLASLRDVAGNSFLRNMQRDEYLSNMNRAGSGTKLDNYVDAIIGSNTVEDVAKAADPFRKTKAGFRLMGNVWFNNVLAKFSSAKALVGGVVLTKGLFPMETFIASLISKASVKLGRPVTELRAHESQVRAGEAGIEFMGWVQGFRDALGPLLKHLKDPDYSIGRTMLSSEDISEGSNLRLAKTWDTQTPVKFIMASVVDAILVNGSRRELMMADTLVKSWAFQQKVKAFSYRIAMNEGLDGQDLIDHMTKTIDEMPDEMFERAFVAGQEATLTQNLDAIPQVVVDTINVVPGFKFFAPFMRTMMSGIQMIFDRMPGVSMASKRVRDLYHSNPAGRDEVLGKWAVGSFLGMAGVYAGYSGEATSGSLLSKQEQRYRFKSGWRPNSMIGEDAYWNMQFTSPVHELFFFGAAVGEMLRYANDGIPVTDPRYKTWGEVAENVMLNSVWTFIDINLNKAVGSGMRELLEAMNDPSRHGERKITGTIAPFFQPYGAARLRRIMDPVRRRVPHSEDLTQRLIDEIKNNLPGLSDDLPPAVGYFGEDRPGYSMLDLFSYSPADPNARLWEALQANNVPTNYVSRTFNMRLPNGAGIEFDLDLEVLPEDFSAGYIREHPEAKKRGYAYYRWSQIRGREYRQALSVAMEQGVLDDLPIGEANNDDAIYTQGDAIKDIFEKAGQAAAKKFTGELGWGLKDLGSKITGKIEGATTERGPVDPLIERKAAEQRERFEFK